MRNGINFSFIDPGKNPKFSPASTAGRTNTILFTKINRELVVQGGFIKSYPTTTSAVTDPGQSTTAMATTAFDVTQTQYIYVSATPSGGTTTDVTYLEAFEIRNY